MAGETQGTAAPYPAPGTLESLGAQPAAANAPARSSAQTLAPQFGGLRGGRKRRDGLVPGSPEALEADRKKDADRKKSERASTRPKEPKPDPPPIPSANSQAQTQAGNLDILPLGEGAPPVPWKAEDIRPLSDELIDTTDAACSKQIHDKAAKALLPAVLVDEITTDAAWDPKAKVALKQSAPELAAKWLNKTGISAEYKHELITASAVVRIGAGHMRVCNRLDELIRNANPSAAQPAGKAEEKKV
jgi:hypothetical protein